MQCPAEAQEIIGRDVLLVGACDPLDGVVILPRLKREQAHQVQAIGMIGVRRQRLQTAELSRQGPAFLHVPQPGLMERGWGEGGVGGTFDWPASIHGSSSMQLRVFASHI